MSRSAQRRMIGFASVPFFPLRSSSSPSPGVGWYVPGAMWITDPGTAAAIAARIAAVVVQTSSGPSPSLPSGQG